MFGKKNNESEIKSQAIREMHDFKRRTALNLLENTLETISSIEDIASTVGRIETCFTLGFISFTERENFKKKAIDMVHNLSFSGEEREIPTYRDLAIIQCMNEIKEIDGELLPYMELQGMISGYYKLKLFSLDEWQEIHGMACQAYQKAKKD